MTDNTIHTDSEQLRARVEAGMAWLDSEAPGWERNIDFATLNLACGCDCVCAQGLEKRTGSRFLGFHHALNRLQSVYDYGFTAFSREDYAVLEAEWRDAIKRRFDTGVLSDDVVRPA